jgi:hypothetical protein
VRFVKTGYKSKIWERGGVGNFSENSERSYLFCYKIQSYRVHTHVVHAPSPHPHTVYNPAIYILAGQSNMVSRNDNVAKAIDIDMTKQKSKVYKTFLRG